MHMPDLYHTVHCVCGISEGKCMDHHY